MLKHWRLQRQINTFFKKTIKLAKKFDQKGDLPRFLRRLLIPIKKGDEGKRKIFLEVTTIFLSYVTALQTKLENFSLSGEFIYSQNSGSSQKMTLRELREEIGSLHSLLEQLIGDVHDADYNHAATVLNGIEGRLTESAQREEQTIAPAVVYVGLHRKRFGNSRFARAIASMTFSALVAVGSAQAAPLELAERPAAVQGVLIIEGEQYTLKKSKEEGREQIELTNPGGNRYMAIKDKTGNITEARVYGKLAKPSLVEKYRRNKKGEFVQITRQDMRLGYEHVEIALYYPQTFPYELKKYNFLVHGLKYQSDEWKMKVQGRTDSKGTITEGSGDIRPRTLFFIREGKIIEVKNGAVPQAMQDAVFSRDMDLTNY